MRLAFDAAQSDARDMLSDAVRAFDRIDAEIDWPAHVLPWVEQLVAIRAAVDAAATKPKPPKGDDE